MLAYHPETDEDLRKRYPRALRHLFDLRRGMPRPRPGELYSNVFDTQDGIRFIISRNRVTDFELLHISAGPMDKTEWHERLKTEGKTVWPEFYQLALVRLFQVFGFDQLGDITFADYSPIGIPHWERKL